MRAQVLLDEPICRYCKQQPSTQADHVIPLSQGGSSTRDNMAGTCDQCHRAKTLAESVRARTAARYRL